MLRSPVAGETPLEIHARKITVDGTLDGTGAGHAGGVGGTDYFGSLGGTGDGRGGGGAGINGFTTVGGGGGGGNGGDGGNGGHYYNFYTTGVGGASQGSEDDPTSRPMGSGGGGGGGDYYTRWLYGGDGGAGGASIYLNSASGIIINGSIHADGVKGEDAQDNLTYINEDGGGGGGAGGTVVLQTFGLSGTGTVTANGGIGGNRSLLSRYQYYAGGGGGGGGGRIKILHQPGYDFGLTLEAEGADAGVSGRTYTNSQIVESGEAGTIYHLEVDPDPDQDNINIPFDNCPDTFNPVQFDEDGDGQGDVCDVCPNP